MEFDTTIQNRWKVSLGFFVVGCAVFALVGRTQAAWYEFHWMVGGLVWLFGGLFALLSLAARETQRAMGWLGLLLNIVLPTITFVTFFPKV